jgi:hypothetical protein
MLCSMGMDFDGEELPQPVEEALADKHYVTLMLRLLVDKRGQAAQGVILDVETQQSCSFRNWRSLMHCLHKLQVSILADLG